MRRQLEHARELIFELTDDGRSCARRRAGIADVCRRMSADARSGGAAVQRHRRRRRRGHQKRTRCAHEPGRVELILGLLSAAAAVAMGLLLRRAGARQSARFRSLVHNSVDLITVIDGRGRVRYQSPSSTRVLGLAAERDRRHAVHRLGAPG